MSDVIRYDPHYGEQDMLVYPDGDFVLYEDYARLEAELAEAVELLRKVTNQPFLNSKLVKDMDAFLARTVKPEVKS